MKRVKKSANPINTWLGGLELVPSDVLTKDKTTIIRVNEVVMIKIIGINDKRVITTKVSTILVDDP